MSQFSDVIKNRYSVRSFTNQPVEQEKIDAIIQAGMDAPTAVNAQPIKIWVLQSPQACKNACDSLPFEWAKEAQVFFVVGTKATDAWVRGQDGYNFADVDGAIVATHMMLTITDQGLGSTWCGHFDPAILKKHFPDMNDYHLIAVFPTGYINQGHDPNPRHFQSKSKEEMVQTY